MPQSERSQILKKLLKWIDQLTEVNKGVPTQAIISHTIEEICEMGATEKTARDYIEDLGHSSMIEYQHPFWKITKKGKDWLDRHP